MAARLGQDALARVDHQDGDIGGRGAGCHVARILFMAGRVGNNELALVGGKETIGDINRDALFALGGEAVNEEGEVNVLALRADAFGVRLERGELVLEDHLGIVEEAADQGRLAIIHAAAGDEPQEGLVFVLLQVGADV